MVKAPYTSYVLARGMRKLIIGGLMTLFGTLIIGVYLSPFAYMFVTAFKNRDQITSGQFLPISPSTFEYEGQVYSLYEVPFEDGTVRQLALVDKGREESTFIDPQNPEAGLVTWPGRWRTLVPAEVFDPQYQNFQAAWDGVNFPRLFFNTLNIAVFGVIGTLLSSIVVAYGFARFPIPGKNILFIILIGTIILPSQVTLVPTYAFFSRIGWVGTWLPLIVPHFFANAYNVFLLRQYFMTIPRELDEAAMIDGANPFQILLRVIIPQSIPVIVAVSLFHLVFAWNDYFQPLIYLLGEPELQPISVGIQVFNFIYDTQPNMIQATALMGLILPIIIFFFSQRVFMQGVVFTGVDK